MTLEARIPGLVIAFAVLAGAVHGADAVTLRVVPPIYADDRGGGLREPEGVACNGDLLVVADTGNGRLVPFVLGADRLEARPAIVTPELPYPVRVKLDSSGGILVLDGRERSIGRIAPGGGFSGYLALDEGVVPKSLDVGVDDRVYVLDVAGARVLVLEPDGAVRAEIAFPEDYGYLSDLTVDPGGTVFAVDSARPRVWYAPPGKTVLEPLTDRLDEEMYFPVGIEADGRGRLFVVDQNGGGIVILGVDGSFRGRQSRTGWKDGFLRHPAAACVDPAADLFVADRDNNRVQPFQIAD